MLPEYDSLAVRLAESWWPDRYVGDLTRADWERVYDGLADALRHPERFLSAEEIAEYERCKQSVIDARRSAERNEGQRYIG